MNLVDLMIMFIVVFTVTIVIIGELESRSLERDIKANPFYVDNRRNRGQ